MIHCPETLESALYKGTVFHARFLPKKHQFNYQIFLYWIKLSELEQLDSKIKNFAYQSKAWSMVRFKRSDYLGDHTEKLEHSVLEKMNALHPHDNETLDGDVFMLGQVRTLGLYFSPVNFYYLRNNEGVFTHILAEVSNTPWNERHHYLVDLNKQEDTDKKFFVSPFNPMDMIYQWNIKPPDKHLSLSLTCLKKQKHFVASLQLEKQALNSTTLFKNLVSIPSMTIKTVFGIYWQATKLFFKRIPIYSHN